MAQHYNPRISDAADLIFYLDAVNTKSYPGSGSTWYDVSPNANNHFTLFNTPTYTQNGTIGTYLTFNGTNQYARSANAINFNAYSAVTIEIGYRTTVTNATQILYETTGTGGSTATGGITLLMNANSTGTVANTYLSQWQGYGPRLFGFTPTTNTSFNSVAETFVNGVDTTGRQALINGTTAQFFTNTAVTVLTSATTNNMNGVDILVIGGGGAGGHLGGGGAGGHQYFTNQSLVANTNYTVTVGAGGTASTGATGNTGSNSVFNIYTSAGGGGGAGEAALPTTGGSGGGGGGVAGTSRPGAAGNTPSTSPSQGNTGGNGNDNGAGTAFAGGGGGGAGGTGNNASGITTAGNGGLGTANSITGSSVTRAAGGGGGAYQLGGTGTAGTGGSSIGGNGGRNGLNATGGSPNTGSGGGGNGYTDAGNLQGSSGAGGSGVVIIKYSNSVTISNPGGGLTFTTDSASVAGYNITTFTAGTGQVSFNETRFANTWTYVASRAGTGNFFRGDIAYIRAWGKKLATTDLGNNVSINAARQPLSYQTPTILTSDPSSVPVTVAISSIFNGLCAYLQGFLTEFQNPSFYSYTLDGSSTFISDGGGDMYDSGNYTYPWLISGANYSTNASGPSDAVNVISYSNDSASITLDTDFVYRTLGYGTSPDRRPLTVLGYRSGTSKPIGFQKSGNSGADGGGTLSSATLYNGSTVNSFTVYAFHRETYNAGDPSHCDLYMLIGHTNFNSVFGTVLSYADPVSNGGNGGYLYAANSSNVIAVTLLLSKNTGVEVTAAECQTVVQNFTSRMKTHLGF